MYTALKNTLQLMLYIVLQSTDNVHYHEQNTDNSRVLQSFLTKLYIVAYSWYMYT
jgi:hypothetical protein